MLLVLYISWVYLGDFLKVINIERPGSGLIMGPLFTIFPVLILWALAVLVFKSNGIVTKKTID